MIYNRRRAERPETKTMSQKEIDALLDKMINWQLSLQEKIEALNQKDELTDSQQEKLDHLENLLEQVDELANALTNVNDAL